MNTEIFEICKKYRDSTIINGWAVYSFSLDKYWICFTYQNSTNLNLNDIKKDIWKHGIELDPHNYIYSINEEEFYNTLYLWQAQELGIL